MIKCVKTVAINDFFEDRRLVDFVFVYNTVVYLQHSIAQQWLLYNTVSYLMCLYAHFLGDSIEILHSIK